MKLNICSIVKDESFYLEEWIEYHLLQGVDYFYMYSNDSTDETNQILDNYKSLKILDWKPWPRRHDASTQLFAYHDFLITHKTSDHWCAMIDADEFLYVSPFITVKQWINQFDIEDKFNPNAIVVPWMLYGTNGHIDRTDSLVMERFTRRSEYYDQHVKTILRPYQTKGIANDVHSFSIQGLTVNAWFEPVPDKTPVFEFQAGRKLTVPILRVNHYHTKSTEEYRKRCAKGRVDIEGSRDFDENLPMHDRNEVEDLGMLTFAEKIKENIRNRPWNTQTSS